MAEAQSDDQNIRDSIALNIALLLQTLDANGNPSDGIEITPERADDLAEIGIPLYMFNTYDNNLNENYYETFKALFSDIITNWKDIVAVQDHLDNANGIVGTWLKAGSDAEGLVFIKLEADGRYLLLSDQEGTTGDTLQVGAYQVDSILKTITFYPYGEQSTTLVSNYPYPIKVSEDLLDFELTVDDSISDVVETFTFERTISLAAQAKTPDTINGIWKFDNTDNDKLVIFNKDNTYAVHSLEGGASDSTDGTVVYEKGTYQLSPSGAFTFTVTEETDGKKGFSGANPTNFSVEDGVLTLTFTNGEDTEPHTLTKLFPFEQVQ